MSYRKSLMVELYSMKPEPAENWARETTQKLLQVPVEEIMKARDRKKKKMAVTVVGKRAMNSIETAVVVKGS